MARYGPHIASKMKFKNEHKKTKGTSGPLVDNELSFREYFLLFKATRKKSKEMLDELVAKRRFREQNEQVKKVMEPSRPLSYSLMSGEIRL